MRKNRRTNLAFWLVPCFTQNALDHFSRSVSMKIVGSNSSPFEFLSMKNLESDLAEIRILFVGLEKIMRIQDQPLNLMLARSVNYWYYIERLKL